MTDLHPTRRILFFAGTDTEVGKTYVACLVARKLCQFGHRVGVYKPVASGCERRDGELFADDAVQLWRAAGCPRTLPEVCPQRFSAPLAPPAAAAAERKQVDATLLRTGADPWRSGFDVLIIEGAGGLFSPLADGILNIDLALALDAQIVLVAANRLGVIHQVLTCCEAAAHRHAKLVGMELCDPTGHGDESTSTNAEQIARYSDIPILGNVPFGGGPDDVGDVQCLLK